MIAVLKRLTRRLTNVTLALCLGLALLKVLVFFPLACADLVASGNFLLWLSILNIFTLIGILKTQNILLCLSVINISLI